MRNFLWCLLVLPLLSACITDNPELEAIQEWRAAHPQQLSIYNETLRLLEEYADSDDGITVAKFFEYAPGINVCRKTANAPISFGSHPMDCVKVRLTEQGVVVTWLEQFTDERGYIVRREQERSGSPHHIAETTRKLLYYTQYAHGEPSTNTGRGLA